MKIAVLMLGVGFAWAQPPGIEEIMRRVAANQASSLEARKSYVYQQKQHLRMLRGAGRVAREERREYVVTPAARGVHKELTRFEGKYESHKQYFSYDRPGYEYKEIDIDGELIDDLSKDMMGDRESKDGIARDLFPLTSTQQLKYHFKMLGAQGYRGRTVYRVGFEPVPNPEGERIWKGEALVDAEEFQPVLVTTKMALKVPLLVKSSELRCQ